MWAIEKISNSALEFAKVLEKQKEKYIFVTEDEKGYNYPSPEVRSNITNHYGSLGLAQDLSLDEHLSSFDFTKMGITPDKLLNYDYELVKLGTLLNNYLRYFVKFGKDSKIFIRPDSSCKEFTGRLFDIIEFRKCPDEFSGLLDYNTLLVVASPKEIMGEWRIATYKNKIWDSSMYLFQGNLSEIRNFPAKALGFVEEILADYFSFLDLPLILDIAMTEPNVFKVIEINNLWTSNWYEMDAEVIYNQYKKIQNTK